MSSSCKLPSDICLQQRNLLLLLTYSPYAYFYADGKALDFSNPSIYPVEIEWGIPGSFSFLLPNITLTFPLKENGPSYKDVHTQIQASIWTINAHLTSYGHQLINEADSLRQAYYHEPQALSMIRERTDQGHKWINAGDSLLCLLYPPFTWHYRYVANSIYTWYNHVEASEDLLPLYKRLPRYEQYTHENANQHIILDAVKVRFYQDCITAGLEFEQCAILLNTIVPRLIVQQVRNLELKYEQAKEGKDLCLGVQEQRDVHTELVSLKTDSFIQAAQVQEDLEMSDLTPAQAKALEVNYELRAIFDPLPASIAAAASNWDPAAASFIAWLGSLPADTKIHQFFEGEKFFKVPDGVLCYMVGWSLNTIINNYSFSSAPDPTSTIQTMTGRSLMTFLREAIHGIPDMKRPCIQRFCSCAPAMHNMLHRLLYSIEDLNAVLTGTNVVNPAHYPEYECLPHIISCAGALVGIVGLQKVEPSRRVVVASIPKTKALALEDTQRPAASAPLIEDVSDEDFGRLSICQGTVESPTP